MTNATAARSLRADAISRAVLAAGLCLGAAPAAFAQSGLELELGGDIESRCTIGDVTALDIDFSDGDRGAFRFDLFCNTEMTISLASKNGGLLHQARAAAAGDDVGYLHRYTATLSLENAGFRRTFTSDQLKQRVTVDITGGVIFSDVGYVELELDESLSRGYAGRYSDRISIAVFPSLATALN